MPFVILHSEKDAIGRLTGEECLQPDDRHLPPRSRSNPMRALITRDVDQALVMSDAEEADRHRRRIGGNYMIEIDDERRPVRRLSPVLAPRLWDTHEIDAWPWEQVSLSEDVQGSPQ